MAALTFTGRLESIGPNGTWTALRINPTHVRQLGITGRTAVKGKLNGHVIRTSVFPQGDGEFYLLVNKGMQAAVGVSPGDRAQVELSVDAQPRQVPLPEDFERALLKSPRARKFFDELSYTHRKECVAWIAEAKLAPTRAKRIKDAVAMFASGIKWSERGKQTAQRQR